MASDRVAWIRVVPLLDMIDKSGRPARWSGSRHRWQSTNEHAGVIKKLSAIFLS